MSQVEIGDAGPSLRDLVERAEAGEDVTLVRDGRAVARIVALADPESVETMPGLRRLGLATGDWSVPDDFDAPLPDELLDLFEGDPEAIARDRAGLRKGSAT